MKTMNHSSCIESIVESAILPVLEKEADAINRDGQWPCKTMRALQDEGMAALMIPRALGGIGGGLSDLLNVTRLLGRLSGSAGLCFGMHSVACAVLVDKPTDYHVQQYIAAICEGRHLSTLALSEPGTGVHFYLPTCQLVYSAQDRCYYVTGKKCFVTNAGQVDSYIISTLSNSLEKNDAFTCALLRNDNESIAWDSSWNGFGMNGNHSKSLQLDRAKIFPQDVIGELGDHTHYLFSVILPNFLAAMSGTYLGIVEKAINVAENHLKTRMYSHTEASLANSTVLQHKLGRLYAQYRSLYHLAFQSARQYDLSAPNAILDVLLSKAEIAEVGIHIVNECMTLMGGKGYVEPSPIADALRDIRAASVMSPTSDLLYLWAGRSRLGLSLLD